VTGLLGRFLELSLFSLLPFGFSLVPSALDLVTNPASEGLYRPLLDSADELPTWLIARKTQGCV